MEDWYNGMPNAFLMPHNHMEQERPLSEVCEGKIGEGAECILPF